ncbi:chaplin family protein [Streptomyces sp. NPDC057798]|uniref:chaplin family protein n=1 Tax=Streptomyces sp. NPDC057798 TaxID=3346252 RepID=UPI003691306D
MAALSALGVSLATPAWAGGVGAIGLPAFDNTCRITTNGAHSARQTVHGSGALTGNVAQAPLDMPRNNCGNTDPQSTLQLVLRLRGG